MNFKKQRLKELLTPVVKSILHELSEAPRQHEIDNDKVEELILYAENDEPLYRILMDTFLPALQKFVKRGTFDEQKALKLLEYYYSNYARPAYKREFGEDLQLNPAERKIFSQNFLDSLKSDGYLKIPVTPK